MPAPQEAVNLVVVGPEQMLSEGVADVLRKHGVQVFGPSQAAAELESSKAYAKEFMKRHKIPTAEYQAFKGKESLDAALRYVDEASGALSKPQSLGSDCIWRWGSGPHILSVARLDAHAVSTRVFALTLCSPRTATGKLGIRRATSNSR